MMRTKESERWASAGCLAVAAFLGMLTVAKLAVWAGGGPAAAQQALQEVSAGTLPCLEELMAPYKEQAESLKKEHHFKPPSPPPPKPQRCMGIAGDKAFIDGKWVKVGDKVGIAEVLAIEPTSVKLRWQEEEITLSPMKAAGGGGGPPRGPKGPPGPPMMKPGPMPAGPPHPAPVAAEGEDPLAWLGVTLTPGQRERFLAIWNSMSDEQKAEAKQRWSQMPQEQKQQMVEAMSRGPRMGRGGPGRRRR